MSRWAAEVGATALTFVPVIPAPASGGPGSGVDHWIDGAEGHHLARVRRVGVGESVVLADGSGAWCPSEVVAVDDGRLGVRVLGAVEHEPELTPRITVAFAPAKADHGAEVTRQLVEIGVDRIIPLITERSVVRWSGSRAAKQVERLRGVAREAAAQAHRARRALVEDAIGIDRLASAAAGAQLLVGDRAGVAPAAVPLAAEWCVVVGPEGGLSAADLAECAAASTVAAGPHVLRAVTAPVAIAAALSVRRSM